jgi:hypothetical protein
MLHVISAKHKQAVGNAKLDKATLKNIWHSKKEAWKGIDDILPTGARNHTHNSFVLDFFFLLFTTGISSVFLFTHTYTYIHT